MNENALRRTTAQVRASLGVKLRMTRHEAEQTLERAGFSFESIEMHDPASGGERVIHVQAEQHDIRIHFDVLTNRVVENICVRSGPLSSSEQGLHEIKQIVLQRGVPVALRLLFRRPERFVRFRWEWQDEASELTLDLSTRDAGTWQLELNETSSRCKLAEPPGMNLAEASELYLRAQIQATGALRRDMGGRDEALRRWTRCLFWKLDIIRLFLSAVEITNSSGGTVRPAALFARLADHASWYRDNLSLFNGPDDWRDAIVVRTCSHWIGDSEPDPWSTDISALSELDWIANSIPLGDRQKPECTVRLVEGPFAFGAFRTKTIYPTMPHVEIYPITPELKLDEIEVNRIAIPNPPHRRRPPKSKMVAKHIRSGMEVQTEGYLSDTDQRILKTLLAARVAAK